MSIDDHASTERDGHKVPLIGLPPWATEQECQRCHDMFPLTDVELTPDGLLLCRECMEWQNEHERDKNMKPKSKQWEPIETLDKSEYQLVLLYADGAMRLLLWDPQRQGWESPEPIGHLSDFKPTHWMTLPAPPEECRKERT